MRPSVPVAQAMEAVSIESISEISYDEQVAVSSTSAAAPISTTNMHVVHRRSADGSWSEETTLLVPGPNGPIAAGRILSRNDSTFVLMRDGSVRLIDQGAQHPSANAAIDSARGVWIARQRDSLGLVQRDRSSPTRQGAQHDPRRLLFVLKSAAPQVHSAFRTASRSTSPAANGAIRYSGATGSGRFDFDVDSGTGAVTRLTATGSDGMVVTTSHAYAPLPGGDLVRASSRSNYVGTAKAPLDRVVTINYANILVR